MDCSTREHPHPKSKTLASHSAISVCGFNIDNIASAQPIPIEIYSFSECEVFTIRERISGGGIMRSVCIGALFEPQLKRIGEYGQFSKCQHVLVSVPTTFGKR